MPRNNDNRMVPYNGRRAAVNVASVIGPALLRSVANTVTQRVMNSLPSMEQAGRAAGDFYSGVTSRKKSMITDARLNDTTVSLAPVSYGTRVVKRRAKISHSKGRNKATTITNREMISGSIPGSTSFTIQNNLSLNPGLAATFPWLSTQAGSYEQYRFLKLEFEYVPIAPTSKQGDIVMCADYDPINPAPTSEIQAVDHDGAIIDSIWKHTVSRLPARELHAVGPRKYIRTTVVHGDLKSYDAGKMFVCTNNETDNTVIGKLFVSYVVELYTPTIAPTSYTLASATTAIGNIIAQNLITGGSYNLDPNYVFSDVFNVVIAGSAGFKTITMPYGFYRVEYGATFKNTAAELFTASLTLTVNGVAVLAGSIPTTTLTNVANGTISLSGSGLVSIAPGTPSFAVAAMAVGATGTLTILANSTYINIMLA